MIPSAFLFFFFFLQSKILVVQTYWDGKVDADRNRTMLKNWDLSNSLRVVLSGNGLLEWQRKSFQSEPPTTPRSLNIENTTLIKLFKGKNKKMLIECRSPCPYQQDFHFWKEKAM